ncbi:hypothetical protein P152DRAFT_476729 [Eremomyces bilateralis CBS 781.70]|uniref:DUF1687-domain-containing protein n=1 Tax=Eremomyces bilateralis CBS 781.70 TaxID=1392243 RepID=A0A6G1FTP1_9PEZI|nr:uncharacterized protein P152DRAFT_476729 [Eremomyces bilateralis CBS 781.70]KAF1809167.1 hypothetical protein P152DRAFT_476729 [Eremomyces bilateralis CBS 781.70]
MFKNLFKEHGVKNVVTLFHKPSVSASTRILTQLKQASATSNTTATVDQASSHEAHNQSQHAPFDLDVVEEPPTSDQLQNIIEYVGNKNAGKVVTGASDVSDAVRRLEHDAESFQRPVTVDWTNGKAVIGEDKSEILHLLKSLPKE